MLGLRLRFCLVLMLSPWYCGVQKKTFEMFRTKSHLQKSAFLKAVSLQPNYPLSTPVPSKISLGNNAATTREFQTCTLCYKQKIDFIISDNDLYHEQISEKNAREKNSNPEKQHKEDHSNTLRSRSESTKRDILTIPQEKEEIPEEKSEPPIKEHKTHSTVANDG